MKFSFVSPVSYIPVSLEHSDVVVFNTWYRDSKDYLDAIENVVENHDHQVIVMGEHNNFWGEYLLNPDKPDTLERIKLVHRLSDYVELPEALKSQSIARIDPNTFLNALNQVIRFDKLDKEIPFWIEMYIGRFDLIRKIHQLTVNGKIGKHTIYLRGFEEVEELSPKFLEETFPGLDFVLVNETVFNAAKEKQRWDRVDISVPGVMDDFTMIAGMRFDNEISNLFKTNMELFKNS